MGKFVTITEANGVSNVGISQLSTAEAMNLTHDIKTEVMIHSLKLDYNILLERMISGINVPIDTFSLSNTIIDSMHITLFVSDTTAQTERNSKALAKILYSELVRVGMQVAKRSTLDVQIPDNYINELENMALKSLKILL